MSASRNHFMHFDFRSRNMPGPLFAALLLAAWLSPPVLAQTVDELVARNIAARGGDAAWRAVDSLRYTGQMELGQGMLVPYVLEQKRPGKMCIEYVFDAETAIQCYDGKSGWKVAPFAGRTAPVPLSNAEQRAIAGLTDLYGPLFDYAARGHRVALLGKEQVEGRDAWKLKVTLPGGNVRWVYLDAETGLEVKLEAVRNIAGREQRIETFYRDWVNTEGLLIPHRQESRSAGSGALHPFIVDEVQVNPPIDDARFAMPVNDPGRYAHRGESPS